MAKKKVFQISNALTEGLEETVTAAHNYNGELRVEVIPLRKIELDPDNPRDLVINFNDLINGLDKNDRHYARKLQEKESLMSLANSIIEQGIINPIVVYKFGDKYRLVAGERRSLASTLAQKSDIQAKILEKKPNDLKISLLQWMENVERKDLSLWERLVNLDKIIESFLELDQEGLTNITPTDLSRLLGCSLPHAMNYCAVLKADRYVKELIQTNQIKNLEKAALVALIKSPEIKESAIEACLNGATLKQLKLIASSDKVKKPAQTVQLQRIQGRQASIIKLGATANVTVAKIVLNSVLKLDKFAHLNQFFDDLNWADYNAINRAFRLLLKNLEQIEA